MDKIIEKLRNDFILKWIYQPTGSKKINDFQLVSITAKRNRATNDLNALINSAKAEERKRCAKIAEKKYRNVINSSVCDLIAKAIRK